MKQLYRGVQFIKIIRQEHWAIFVIHLPIWLMLTGGFYLLSLSRNEGFPVSIAMLYAYGFIIFYLNYFFLTPSYLLPKKHLTFFVSLLVIIVFSYFVVDPFIHQMAGRDFVPNLSPIPHGFRDRQLLDGMSGERLDIRRINMPRPQLGMFFLLFTFLILSSLIRIFQKLKQEEYVNQQYQHEKLKAELMMLRQQVNPHFLFNSLNNILSLANRKSALTVEAIEKLSVILRHMLSENPRNEIPVTREVDLIQNYIDLQKLWMKNTVTVDFVVENVTDSYCIEPFILNPLVENAFKYGTLPGLESNIIIKIKLVDNWLHFKASNPVVHGKLSEVASMGIGVNNVIRRLELCYPGNYKIAIVQKENNYQVDLSIKLRPHELYCN